MALPLFHLAPPVSSPCLAGDPLTLSFFFPVSLVWFSHLALSCPAIGRSASLLTLYTVYRWIFPQHVCSASETAQVWRSAFRNSTVSPGIEPRWPDFHGRSMINSFYKTFTVQFQPKNQMSSPPSTQFPQFLLETQCCPYSHRPKWLLRQKNLLQTSSIRFCCLTSHSAFW